MIPIMRTKIHADGNNWIKNWVVKTNALRDDGGRWLQKDDRLLGDSIAKLYRWNMVESATTEAFECGMRRLTY
jgi:hypothetical protein